MYSTSDVMSVIHLSITFRTLNEPTSGKQRFCFLAHGQCTRDVRVYADDIDIHTSDKNKNFQNLYKMFLEVGLKMNVSKTENRIGITSVVTITLNPS